MTNEARLRELMQALALITGRSLLDEAVTLGDLGVDSRHLVELIVACDEIYGPDLQFEALDITTETSIGSLHGQILALLGHAVPRNDANSKD